jgi:hypothetical protein
MSARLLNGGARWPQGSQQRHRIVVRLLLEGLVLALVLAFMLWAIVTLGKQSVAAETHSPVAGSAPTSYAVECSVLETSRKGAAPPTAAVEGAHCPAKAGLTQPLRASRGLELPSRGIEEIVSGSMTQWLRTLRPTYMLPVAKEELRAAKPMVRLATRNRKRSGRPVSF